MKDILAILALIGIAFLFMVVASQSKDTEVRARIEMKEPFSDVSGTPLTVKGVVETGAITGSPADIENQRQPYHLLRGVLPDADKDKLGLLNAQTCYETDFQKRFEPVHTYLQRTNNYKRAGPDSCSSPMTQFVTSFYKVEPVN